MPHTPAVQPLQILEKHGVRKTETRLSVLQVFLAHHHALAHSTLEKELGASFDRVTLYRTLHTFEEAGIIHPVPSSNGEQRFALCHDSCDIHHHQDQHLHFYCSKCGQTYCLEEAPLPAFNYPSSYEIHAVNVLASGICKNCKK